MEFMYCIPDLEVFIDKTIKKCLLEYDLDANDTEAVLDDMEKAWPKSPHHSLPEMTKDCNGNTKNGRVSLDPFRANDIQGGAFNNMRTDATKGGPSVMTNISSESGQRLNSNEDLSKSGLVKSPSVGGDSSRSDTSRGGASSRSDTSSPDAGGGKLQNPSHSKLKSRLQRRYFEGSKVCSAPNAPSTQGATYARVYDIGGCQAPNNLHLLASAANLHTRRSRGTGVVAGEAVASLNEQSTGNIVDTTIESFSKCPSGEHELHSDRPVRGLLPALSSSLSSLSPSSRLEISNSNGCLNGAGLHLLPGMESKKPESWVPMTGLRPHDSENVGQGHKHNGLPLKENLQKHRFSSNKRTGDILGCEEEVVRGLQDRVCPSGVTEDKARRLLEHYQKGYHSLIPRDLLGVRQELSPTSETTDLADKGTIPRLSSVSQKGSLQIQKMKRRLTPSSDNRDDEDQITAKQLICRSETEDLELGEKRQLPLSCERSDLIIKKMKKQLPFLHTEGKVEFRNRHSPTEVHCRNFSLTLSDQRPVSAPNCYNPTNRGDNPEFNTHEPSHDFKSNGFFNQLHYYPSRIASIIVEELEKDNIGQPEVIPTAHKLNPDNPPINPSAHKLSPDNPTIIPSAHKCSLNNQQIIPSVHKFSPDNPTVIPPAHMFSPDNPTIIPPAHKFSLHNPPIIPPAHKFSPDNPTIIPPAHKFSLHNPPIIPPAHKFSPDNPTINPPAHKFSLHNPPIIPPAHKFSLHNPPHVSPKYLTSSALKSKSLLSWTSQAGPSWINTSQNLINSVAPLLGNISNSVSQILPAHTPRPSQDPLKTLLAFHLGHMADVKHNNVTAFSGATDETGPNNDDVIQPEDLSKRSNTSSQNQHMPAGTVSSPNLAAIEDQSEGYFSSPTSPVLTRPSYLARPTSPVLTTLLGSYRLSPQVLPKPSSSSPHENHKTEINYSSDSEAAMTSYKTLGHWEKKGQVHSLGIPPKGNSKAVERRRAETLKTWSVSGESYLTKTK